MQSANSLCARETTEATEGKTETPPGSMAKIHSGSRGARQAAGSEEEDGGFEHREREREDSAVYGELDSCVNISIFFIFILINKLLLFRNWEHREQENNFPLPVSD